MEVLCLLIFIHNTYIRFIIGIAVVCYELLYLQAIL
jgi:hypothetical protein